MRARIVPSPFVGPLLATCVALQGCVFAAKNNGLHATAVTVAAVPPIARVTALATEGTWPAAPLSTLRFAAAAAPGVPLEAIALPASGIHVGGTITGAASMVLRVHITLAYAAATAGATAGASQWTIAQGSMDLGGREAGAEVCREGDLERALVGGVRGAVVALGAVRAKAKLAAGDARAPAVAAARGEQHGAPAYVTGAGRERAGDRGRGRGRLVELEGSVENGQ